jgi:hypothetical protein
MPKLSVEIPEDLKRRLEKFSDDNGISQIGAVRMLLYRNLPERCEE